MKRITISLAFFSILVLLISCKKTSIDEEKTVAPKSTPIVVDSAATYKMTIEGIWQMPQLTVPAGNHFTNFIGMAHSGTTGLFKLDQPATLGIENVAEVGNSTELIKEINISISAGTASQLFNLSIPGITGSASQILNVNKTHSSISFVSMIAPSPDWFVGLQSYDLIQNGNWVNEIIVNAFGYDAGTEDGDVFGYNNPATMPQQNISYLTGINASVIANGNQTVAPFVRVKFIKQ